MNFPNVNDTQHECDRSISYTLQYQAVVCPRRATLRPRRSHRRTYVSLRFQFCSLPILPPIAKVFPRIFVLLFHLRSTRRLQPGGRPHRKIGTDKEAERARRYPVWPEIYWSNQFDKGLYEFDGLLPAARSCIMTRGQSVLVL